MKIRFGLVLLLGIFLLDRLVHAQEFKLPDLPGAVQLLTSATENNDGLYMAWSVDGKELNKLACTYIKPAVGGKFMFAPDLVKDPKGVFHLVWATGEHEKGIGYANSKDLVHWSMQKYIPFEETGDCQIPTIFYDDENAEFMITWSSSADETVRYVTTKDFKSFSEPKVITNPEDAVHHRQGAGLEVPGSMVEDLLLRDKAWTGIAPAPVMDVYTADPTIRVFGDTYYIYPTTDQPNWMTTEFNVWSSKNLVDWKFENTIIDLSKEISWANVRAWAPDCIERNGKYYFYFCADGKIGVAVGPTPTGPFNDALGKPLLDRKADKRIHTNTIDPWVFIDDDGQAYLYWGNGRPCQVFKLNEDMISIEGDPVDIDLRDFREGICVFKRNGKYYFMWSVDDARSPNYRVGWGVSDSPFGPVTSPKEFIALQKHLPAIGTAHHSVVNVPGTDRWYVAYHRHGLPGGGGYKRQTCLVRMEFDAEGNILPMDPLTTPFQPGDVGEPIVNGKGLPD